MDGHETVSPNPKTSLWINKEMLRVESRFHLIPHWKNPGLFYQDEDVVPPPAAEIYNNVRFCTLYKPLRGKAQSAFPMVEYNAYRNLAARVQGPGNHRRV